ncbi:hypothetical protein [Marivirga harenae]|uniref:hypothetical protein n=1 Tax=Marivirga harenae TaxID=2010992 RepID=UPI0026DFA948|nr:hypothetical protein [Marivirga harenae]WKV11818.1 hypothetical protein Q3Y49_16570 [Marivirga harenae]
MKTTSIILLSLIITFNILGQDYQIETAEDSLIIRDWDINNFPFNLRSNPLDTLLKMYNPITESQTYQNRHVDDQIDTVFTLKIDASYFEVYKNPSENYITSALFLNKGLQTKHGFHVGSTKEQVRDALEKYKLTEIPNYIRLETIEIPEYFELYFKNGKIVKIKYTGYSD